MNGHEHCYFGAVARSKDRCIEPINVREWKKRHTWKKNTFYW